MASDGCYVRVQQIWQFNSTNHASQVVERNEWRCVHQQSNIRTITLLSSSLLSKKLKIKIYRNTILPVVLYGCETWSPTLREERRLRVFENRVLRRVFGRNRD